MNTWERKANAVISSTIGHLKRDIESGSIDEAELKRILSKKYPFGERAQHPYRIWLRCIDEALANQFASAQQSSLMQWLNDGASDWHEG